MKRILFESNHYGVPTGPCEICKLYSKEWSTCRRCLSTVCLSCQKDSWHAFDFGKKIKCKFCPTEGSEGAYVWKPCDRCKWTSSNYISCRHCKSTICAHCQTGSGNGWMTCDTRPFSWKKLECKICSDDMRLECASCKLPLHPIVSCYSSKSKTIQCMHCIV